MADIKFTINDLSKADLVEIVKALIGVYPMMARVFSEENLAHVIASRKIRELKRLEKKIDSYRGAIKKARSEKKKNAIGREAYPKIERYNKLIDDIAQIRARFPQIFEKEASA